MHEPMLMLKRLLQLEHDPTLPNATLVIAVLRFALPVGLCSMSLIAVTALAVFTSAPYRVRATSNIAENAKAQSLADAGTILAAVELIRVQSGTTIAPSMVSGLSIDAARPTFCAMPSNAVAAIYIEDEGGKVDLNFASIGLLETMMSGFGVPGDLASRIAVGVRRLATGAPGELGNRGAKDIDHDIELRSKSVMFKSALELDQVEGVSPVLFETLLPFVTVYSRSPGIDPILAPPALRAALAGSPLSIVTALAGQPRDIAELANRSNQLSDIVVPAEFAAPSLHATFLIGVEVRTPAGGYFARQVLVEWRGGGEGLKTQEWRRGRGRFDLMLLNQIERCVAGQAPAWPSC